MFRKKKFDVLASEIAEYLNGNLIGEDFIIKSPRCIKTKKFLGRHFIENQGDEDKILFITDEPLLSKIINFPNLSLFKTTV